MTSLLEIHMRRGVTGQRWPLAESLGSSQGRERTTLGSHIVSFLHHFNDFMVIAMYTTSPLEVQVHKSGA